MGSFCAYSNCKIHTCVFRGNLEHCLCLLPHKMPLYPCLMLLTVISDISLMLVLSLYVCRLEVNGIDAIYCIVKCDLHHTYPIVLLSFFAALRGVSYIEKLKYIVF